MASTGLLCLPCGIVARRMTCACGDVEGALCCRAGRQTVQLAEWWADFDERVMRPVFNKPGAMDDWTPRGGGEPTSQAVLGHICAASLFRVRSIESEDLAEANGDTSRS